MDSVPEKFMYTDMICLCIDITYSSETEILFRLLLPEGSDDDRIYRECERIPADHLFRYLVAVNYNVTVNKIAPQVVMMDDSDEYAMFIRCSGIQSQEMVADLASRYKILTSNPRGESLNDAFSGNFIESIGAYQTAESETIVNAMYQVSYRMRRSKDDTSFACKLIPFAIEMSITCLNFTAMKEVAPSFTLQKHSAIYSFIHKVIRECEKEYIKAAFTDRDKTDIPIHIHYRIGHLADGNPDKRNCLLLFIEGTVDRYMNYEILEAVDNRMIFRPIDEVETPDGKRIAPVFPDTLAEAIRTARWKNAYRTIEVLHDSLITSSDMSMISRLLGLHVIRINNAAYFEARFSCCVLNWGTGRMSPEYAQLFGLDYDTNPDFILFHEPGFQIAFPINGVRPVDGVLAFGRYDTNVVGDISQLASEGGDYGFVVTGAYNTWNYFRVVYFPTYWDEIEEGKAGRLIEKYFHRALWPYFRANNYERSHQIASRYHHKLTDEELVGVRTESVLQFFKSCIHYIAQSTNIEHFMQFHNTDIVGIIILWARLVGIDSTEDYELLKLALKRILTPKEEPKEEPEPEQQAEEPPEEEPEQEKLDPPKPGWFRFPFFG